MLAGEVPPAFIGHARVLRIRERLAKIRPRLIEASPGLRQVCVSLLQLLINFGRVNLSQQLSGLNAIADVCVPAAQITVRPSSDGRRLTRLNVSRQYQLGSSRRLSRSNHIHGWDAVFNRLRGFHNLLLPLDARQNTHGQEACEKYQPDQRQNRELEATLRAALSAFDSRSFGRSRLRLIRSRGTSCRLFGIHCRLSILSRSSLRTAVIRATRLLPAI